MTTQRAPATRQPKKKSKIRTWRNNVSVPQEGIVGSYTSSAYHSCCSGKFDHHFRLNQATLTLTSDEWVWHRVLRRRKGKKKKRKSNHPRYLLYMSTRFTRKPLTCHGCPPSIQPKYDLTGQSIKVKYIHTLEYHYAPTHSRFVPWFLCIFFFLPCLTWLQGPFDLRRDDLDATTFRLDWRTGRGSTTGRISFVIPIINFD